MCGLVRLTDCMAQLQWRQQRRYAVELIELSCRALELVTHAGAVWIDSLAPSCRVMLVDQLRHRDLAEIGITQKIRAVIHRPPEGLRSQMHRLRGTITELREIKSF